MTGVEIFALLVVGHFLADYPLQGDFIAKGKNRTAPIPSIPWQHPMAAHTIIHGGFVGIITGSIWLGVAEFAIHWLTDDAKCRGRIGYHADQAIHIACKLLWAIILISMEASP